MNRKLKKIPKFKSEKQDGPSLSIADKAAAF